MPSTKDIFEYSQVRDRILSGLAKVSDPVVGTLTPQGKNVIFEDEIGNIFSTNDGYTIIKNITLDDPVENAIASMVKQASFKTNIVAGDGTTTTILMASNLIRNGFKLIDNGWNPMDLSRNLENLSSLLIDEIDKRKVKVKNDTDLEYIALVSSNNDKEVAKNVSNVIKKSGEDGLVFLEYTNRDVVEIVEENGFVLNSGYFSNYLINNKEKMTAQYDKVLVMITDRRIYYEEEVLAILNKVASFEQNKVVVIAKDFIGQALNIFISNHIDGKINMNILLVKETDDDVLEDLASYLGVEILTEKRGSIIEQLSERHFSLVNKAYSDKHRSVIAKVVLKDNKELDKRIEAIKSKLEEVNKDSPEEKKLRGRLACLTKGITTIKVGGKTQAEVREKLFRYEDSINATRNALKNGYVLGGGVTLWTIFRNLPKRTYAELQDDLKDLLKKFCQSPLEQIAKNCNLHLPTVLTNVTDTVGYNAVTETYADMQESGIIEPVMVLKSAVENSFSIARIILSGNYFILTKQKTEQKHED